MKIFAFVAAAFLALSTAAKADDFDKTGVSISVITDTYGASVSTGANKDFVDDATVVGLSYRFADIFAVRGEVIDDASNTDYRASAGAALSTEVGVATLYAVPELHYTRGDTYSKDELRFSPEVGVSFDTGTMIAPYAEVGYDWVSYDGDFGNLDKDRSFAQAGVLIAISESTDLDIAVLRKMDEDFNGLDNEFTVGAVINF